VSPWAVRAWSGTDGLSSVDRVEEIAPTLDRLFGDERFRAECLERGRRVLERNIKPYGSQGPVAELTAIFDGCFAEDFVSPR
jgi:hypothetical protein